MTDEPIVLAHNVPAQIYNKLPPFLRKLYCILNGTPSHPATPHIISWTPSGSSFTIHSIPLLESQILGQWFKTQTYTSFARQLNIYHFSKITHPQAGSIAYSNKGSAEAGGAFGECWHGENFCRDEPIKALNIRRKAGKEKEAKEAREREQQQQQQKQQAPPPLPDNLLTLEPEQQNSRNQSLLALTTLSTPSQGNQIMINPQTLLTTLSSIQATQKTLMGQLADLKQENRLLWQENTQSRERSERQGEMLSRIFGLFRHFASGKNSNKWTRGSVGNGPSGASQGTAKDADFDELIRNMGVGGVGRRNSGRLMIEGPATTTTDDKEDEPLAFEDAPSPASSDGARFTSLDTPDTTSAPLEISTGTPGPTIEQLPQISNLSNAELTSFFNSLSPVQAQNLLASVLQNIAPPPPAEPTLGETGHIQAYQPEPAPAPLPPTMSNSNGPSSSSANNEGQMLQYSNSPLNWEATLNSLFPLPPSNDSGSQNPTSGSGFVDSNGASGSNITLQHLLPSSMPDSLSTSTSTSNWDLPPLSATPTDAGGFDLDAYLNLNPTGEGSMGMGDMDVDLGQFINIPPTPPSLTMAPAVEEVMAEPVAPIPTATMTKPTTTPSAPETRSSRKRKSDAALEDVKALSSNVSSKKRKAGGL
ncbi:HSF-type DNA-binding-domain-containing protein [Flagelloscypha sp. PMI_526]|nr:HSF-type DNA-binding-domain-containing protein [Flagelloscypha sp. PMI_526]